MPLLAGADGGSGSRSMYENLNASGQLVNVLIELGDNPRGSPTPMPPRVLTGWDAYGDSGRIARSTTTGRWSEPNARPSAARTGTIGGST